MRGALSGVVAALCFVATPALADDASSDRVRCKASYERAQVLVRDEHLEAARAQLLICKTTCPAELVTDCERWSRDVDALTPDVRFVVNDPEGRALTDVRVGIDGRSLDAPLDRAIPLEPGAHVAQFERAGFAPSTTRFEVHAGERDRSIVVVLTRLEIAEARPSTTASYVVGGVGVAALVVSGVLAIKGQVDRASLRSSCAPTCDPANVDTIRTEWWIAAGLGAAGAIAVGLGVYLWPHADRATSAATPQITLSPRAVALTWKLP